MFPCVNEMILISVDNVGDMSATCRHERHDSVISGRHANSANTDHQISHVVSQFSVVVCTTSVVVLTNHKWPVISRPLPFLMWWHMHAIHSSQTACSPGWMGWSWSYASRKRWECSTCKNYFIVWLSLIYVQHNTRPIRPYTVRRHGEDMSSMTFDEDI